MNYRDLVNSSLLELIVFPPLPPKEAIGLLDLTHLHSIPVAVLSLPHL